MFSSVFAVIQNDQMKIFAVTTEGDAVSADLTLEIEPGDGEIWSSIDPLVGTTTQNTERIAIKLASNYFNGKINEFDYKFEIDSDASIVEGPSAGASMALLAISMLQDKPLSSKIGITGTISEQGKVGPVGGVFAKTKEANRIGLKLFMIPKGEARQVIKEKGEVKTVNLVNYAAENWSMKVIEVSNIDEVLKYSFSEIENIDVNTGNGITEIKEFLPEALPEQEDLIIMKQLAKRMLDEAKLTVKGARNALSNTTIEDSAEISFLLTTLNSSEQALIEGETLYEKNYLYSAANSIFISKVYASLVKDVAENPSLLQKDSKLFNIRVDSLKKNIDSLKENLDSFIPLDYLEWHIAAKQRLLWAEMNIKKIENLFQAVIETGIRTQETDVLLRVEDYEFALAWFETARDLYDKTTESEKKVLPDMAFRNYSDEYIIASENSLNSLPEGEQEDILRRLNSAKRAEDYSWFLVTAFDSASSYALIKASIESEELTLEQAHSLLQEKINSIDANLSENKSEEKHFVWTRLYLDHAKYYLNAADYYKEQGYALTALDKLESGLALAFLSEELFTVSHSIYAYYDDFSEEDFIGAEKKEKKEPLKLIDTALLASAFILFTVVLVVAGILILRKTKEQPLEKQLQEMRELKRKADNAFFNGKISEEKHNELNNEYSDQLKELRLKISSGSVHLIESEEKREKAKARERMLRDLKKLRSKKLISLKDFNKEYDKILAEETELEKGSQKELIDLKKEKTEATRKTKLLKNKTKKVFGTKNKKIQKK